MPEKHSKVYIWSGIENISVAAIGFCGNIIFANLLSPNDFGLFAMVAIFSAIAFNLSSCGLSDGLVQKESPTERDYSTVMVFNGTLGLFFCILFICIAQPISHYFRQPALVNIMRCIGICFFFQTLTFVQETRLRKELKMKKKCIVRVLSSLTAFFVGLYLALNGYGYWALVSTQAFLSIFQFIYYMIFTRWIPKIAFYKDSFLSFFGYGVNLMFSYVLTSIGKNISNTLLGRTSAQTAGYYSQAQKMEELPFSLLETTFCNSFFPILSNETDADKKRKLCDDMTSMISLLIFVAAAVMLLVSAPAFNFLFGHKWDAAIPIFRILTVYGAIYIYKQYIQTILKSYGHASTIRNISIAELIIQITLLCIALPYGAVIVACSQVVTIIIIGALYFYYYKKICHIALLEQCRLIIAPIAVPFVAFIASGLGYAFLWEGLPSLLCCIVNCLSFLFLCIIGWEIKPQPIYLKYRTLVLNALRGSDKD